MEKALGHNRVCQAVSLIYNEKFMRNFVANLHNRVGVSYECAWLTSELTSKKQKIKRGGGASAPLPPPPPPWRCAWLYMYIQSQRNHQMKDLAMKRWLWFSMIFFFTVLAFEEEHLCIDQYVCLSGAQNDQFVLEIMNLSYSWFCFAIRKN